MKPRHGNFFTCPVGRRMSLAFKFLYMSKKATHAAFLMAPPDEKTLDSKGKWSTETDPDTDPEYPGRISLGANRAVQFVPKESSYIHEGPPNMGNVLDSVDDENNRR